MLCCLPPCWVDAKSAYSEQTYTNEISGYPGHRRNFVRTAGNALAEAPSPVSSIYPPSPKQPAYDSNQQSDELISVTVPEGVFGGQIIHVAHPDGSGRLIRCEVPPGLTAGALFFVKAPMPTIATQSSPAVTATPMPPPIPQPQHQPYMPSASAYPVAPDHVDLTAMPSPTAKAIPVHSYHNDQYPSRYTPGVRPVSLASPATSVAPLLHMVKVVVPPGTVPGSTIHVQIPGGNRLIAAQVPPNCTEFHVQYDPLEASTPCSSAILHSPPPRQPFQRIQPQAQAQRSYSPVISEYEQQHAEKKLLLVQVPRGTAPGSTLHVEVPDEPGRLLSVTVPPNVKEFHVSYLPRPTSRPRNDDDDDDDDWGSSLLPIAGGLATGLAGALLYEHFAND